MSGSLRDGPDSSYFGIKPSHAFSFISARIKKSTWILLVHSYGYNPVIGPCVMKSFPCFHQRTRFHFLSCFPCWTWSGAAAFVVLKDVVVLKIFSSWTSIFLELIKTFKIMWVTGREQTSKDIDALFKDWAGHSRIIYLEAIIFLSFEEKSEQTGRSELFLPLPWNVSKISLLNTAHEETLCIYYAPINV